MASTLCIHCVELGNFFQTDGYGDFEHPRGLSIPALEKSAAAGCDFCRLLRQEFVYRFGDGYSPSRNIGWSQYRLSFADGIYPLYRSLVLLLKNLPVS